jgi:FHA domain
MWNVVIVIGAACVGLVVGALVTYFLFLGSRSHEQAPSPVEAIPSLSHQIPAPIPATARAQLQEIQFHVQIPDGRILPVRFPVKLTAAQLLTELLADANLAIHPREAGAWSLQNESSGQQLELNKTLEQNGGLEDARLRLVPAAAPESSTSEPCRPVGGLTRCENGHFYDASKYKMCPYDADQSMDLGARNIRIGASHDGGHEEQRDTVPVNPGMAETEPGNDQPTRPIGQVGPAIDTVAGWLVCVGGPEKGKDYRIRSENNTIGRSKDMDICISGDESIVRERHAIVTFDPTCSAFYLSPGGGKALVYVNGEVVLAPRLLRPRDRILMGRTALLFIPFADAAESDGGKSKTGTANLLSPATRDSFRCSVFHPERIGPSDAGKIIAYVHLEIVASKVVHNASQKLELPAAVKMVASSETAIRPLPGAAPWKSQQRCLDCCSRTTELRCDCGRTCSRSSFGLSRRQG